VVDDVGPQFGVKNGRPFLDGLFHIHHGGKRFVLDVNCLQCVFRQIAIFRDDDGYAFADKAGAIHGDAVILEGFVHGLGKRAGHARHVFPR
jgi:hypothetical protein